MKTGATPPGTIATLNGIPRKGGIRVPDAGILEALWSYRKALVAKDHGKILAARRVLDALLVEGE